MRLHLVLPLGSCYIKDINPRANTCTVWCLPSLLSEGFPLHTKPYVVLSSGSQYELYCVSVSPSADLVLILIHSWSYSYRLTLLLC